MLELIFLVLGIIGLIIGTELVVKGAMNIAEHYKLSHIFIGLTILAIGTDLPEFFLAVTGGIDRYVGIETSGIVVGDVIGACFSQIGLALGVIGLFGYITLTKREIRFDGFMLLISVILFFLVAFDGTITLFEGIILVIIYLTYYISLYRKEKVHEKVKKAPPLHIVWDTVSLVAGLAVVVYASTIVIDSGLVLVEAWGVSQSFIGILFVGLGTSLPELAITFGTIFRGAKGMSVGNLVGSNIFDMLVPIGVGAAISPLNVGNNLIWFDIPVLFLLSLLVLLFFMRKKGLQRKEAAVLLLFYLGYVGLKIIGY